MKIFVETLKAIFLGIVQGITEWLPISSTGHLILIEKIIKLDVSSQFFDMFKVVIQLGSIIAIILLYFNRLNPFSPKKTAQQKQNTWKLWLKVFIASIPTGIIGLLLDDIVDEHLSNWIVISITLILYGIFFIVLESKQHVPTVKSINQMSYKTALFIGFFQTLALIPGTSRSGATILGAVILGCSRPLAAEFSFFMAIPAMVGASSFKFIKYIKNYGFAFTSVEVAVLIAGFLTAFIVSLFVVRLFMNFIKKHTFKPFGYYRIALGALVIIVNVILILI